MLIKGLLEFSKSILCKEEVLGKSYKAKIADIDVTVYFPKMPLPNPNNGMCIPLLPPEKVEKIKRGNENIIWGSPIAGREPNSSHIGVHAYVNCVLIEFEDEENETIQDISQRIYEDAVRWENAFVNYCELCTKQNYNRYEQKNYGMEILSLWSHNGAIQSKEMQTITIEETQVSKFSNEKQIQDAIEFASAKKELLIEYQMLLSAYKARQQNLNRQIIIDACAAAELVLINTIIEYSQIKQIPQGELLFRNRRGA